MSSDIVRADRRNDWSYDDPRSVFVVNLSGKLFLKEVLGETHYYRIIEGMEGMRDYLQALEAVLGEPKMSWPRHGTDEENRDFLEKLKAFVASAVHDGVELELL